MSWTSKIEPQKYYTTHTTKHHCTLPKEEPLLVMYISTGCCVSFRRYIRKKTLVSPKNAAAQSLYLSVAAFKKEMDVHMKRNYFMIHPYSDFKTVWETFMVIVAIISVFYYPSLVYIGYSSFIVHLVNELMFIVFLSDIVVNFESGYFDSNTNKVILNRKKVANNYLKTWFIVDFICLLNLNRFLVSDTVCTILNYVSIVRIFMIVRYLNGFTQCTKITFYRFHFTKLIMITLIILWWTTSLLYQLVSLYHEAWFKDVTKFGKVVTCWYRVNYLIFLVGFGEEYSTTDVILIFEISCWIAGTILKIFSFAEVLQIVIKYRSGRNTYHQRMERLKLLMKTKRLPAETRSRIMQYFDFRFQKNYFKEDEILSCFSKQLVDEVLGHNCRKLVENANIFDHIPYAIIEKIILLMKPVIYLKHDVVTKVGDEGGSMFFVHDGAVAVYAEDGLEICHVSDGECFGERAMILPNTTRMATVVAIDACELYTLTTVDFESCFVQHQSLLEKTRERIAAKYSALSTKNIIALYHL